MVECQLPKLDVAGSIPVARSKFQELTLLVPQFARSPLVRPPQIVGKLRRESLGYFRPSDARTHDENFIHE